MTPPPHALKADPFYRALRTYLAAHARITLTVTPEDRGPEGELEDAATAAAIRARIEAGDEWAWCVVRLRASVGWGLVDADEYLGQCSYRDEAEFRADAYYADMREAALDGLALDLYAIAVEIERARLPGGAS